MCGICGVLYFDPVRAAEAEIVRAMSERLAHRGPDDAGFYCQGSLGLGFRRLSVIDPAESRQPIASENGRIRLVCNGEIYNFRALRRTLTDRHEFATRGDVEVIAHLYEDCGSQCVHSLRGMFAFALWDSAADQLLFAVDRFGEKPLYYWLDGEKVIFGSELKAIRAFPGFCPEIDSEALDEYFTCGYIRAPRTIYKAVRRLPAGHTLTIARTGTARLERYWHPEFASSDEWDRRSSDDFAAELRHLLIEAVSLRMVSDMPVGAFLSGGVDSSTVVTLMREITDNPLKTFSVGFDEREYDERSHARAAADFCHTEHYTEVVRADQVIDLLPKLVRHFDEPFADSSIIPTFVVSQLARQQVTVALSGDGGDEVFAGYHQHLYGYRQQYLESIIPRSLYPAAVRAAALLPRTTKVKPYLAALGRPARAWLSNGFFSAAQRDRLFDTSQRVNADVQAEDFSTASRLDRLSQLQLHDLTAYLPNDILVKVDRASMLASLEVRAPLLDHILVEFMAKVPPWRRMTLTSGKTLLKKAAGSSLPPVARCRRKQGFSIPQAEWLRAPLQPMLRDVLNGSTAFNQPYLRSLIDDHTAGRADHKDRLWALLCYELWRCA